MVLIWFMFALNASDRLDATLQTAASISSCLSQSSSFRPWT